MTTYRAVVFDMDGVLADSEPTYAEAMDDVLASLGKTVTPELHARIMGTGVEDTWAILIRELDLPGKMEDYIPAYDRKLVERLEKLRDPLPGVVPLIRTLRESRIPIAVASSSWMGWMEALLGGIGLRDAFDALASATEVAHPKPAPDLYLLAASKLGVPPEACVAIEDTPTGLRAAGSAGMYAVQVRASSTAFAPLDLADAVIDTLEDFDLSLLGLNGLR
jgi:HAD superfamily hydrolase (TIGR01509 family)